jgi:hypothetical protein
LPKLRLFSDAAQGLLEDDKERLRREKLRIMRVHHLLREVRGLI